MTQVLTPIRAAEAMREAAAKAVAANTAQLRHGGYHESADAYEGAARLVRALSVESVLTDLPAPTADEVAAFESAAKNELFNVQQRDSGEYLHPITKRAFSVWRAAVRWADEQHQSN